MKQYIDKATVVAEIEGYISNYKDIVAKTYRNDSTWVDSVSMIDAKIDVLQHVLFFLDTLKVKDEVVSTDPIKAMKEALRMEYEKGRADVLRCIDQDEMVADFCSQPLSKTRSLASIYRQGITDILKRINNNEKTSITSTRSIDDGGVR